MPLRKDLMQGEMKKVNGLCVSFVRRKGIPFINSLDFPHLKSQDGGEKQEQKGNFKKDGFKGRNGFKAMHVNSFDGDDSE